MLAPHPPPVEVTAPVEAVVVVVDVIDGVGLGGGVGVTDGGGGGLILTTWVDAEQKLLRLTLVNSAEVVSAQPAFVTSRIRNVLFSPVNVTPIIRKSEGSFVHPIWRLSAMARITKLLVVPSRVQVTSP